jgi:uncharacterized protein with ATP-grasp and redox domains
MKTSLDCVACFVRQTLEATRMVSTDHVVHERLLREVLRWIAEMDLNESPPVLAQRIHRRLREISGVADPYRAAKDHWNQLALSLLPDLKTMVQAAPDPFAMALRLAIAGNVIDMGVHAAVTETDLRRSIDQVLTGPLTGDLDAFRKSVAEARNILYLADNAGEIVFDRLLLRELWPARVTVAVRGAPVLNDATRADAQAAGLTDEFTVIDNGSDAPGTILAECSAEFRRQFDEADLILAKGQGNFETLNEEPANIFFLFKVKCPVIAADVGQPVGSAVLWRKSA